MTRHLLRLLVCVSVLSAAQARQPVSATDALLGRVAALERRAADGALAAGERERAADDAIAARAGLIDTADGDPRRVSWLIDQAGAVLARLSRDAADTTALFAMPTDEQRARACAAATQAGVLLERSRSLVSAVTEEETRLSLREGGDRAAALLTAQRDDETRGNLVRGRSRALLAAADAPAARPTHAQAAIDALAGIVMEDASAEAARRVNLGAALVFRGDDGDARAATAQFDWAAGDSRLGRNGVLPATTAEALLGRLHAGALSEAEGAIRDLDRSRDLPPRMARGRPDALWRLVFADAVGRACVDRWGGTRDAAWLARAFAPHEAILAGRVDLGLDPSPARSLVFPRMDALVRRVGEPLPVAAMPSAVLVARAVMLERGGIAAERAEARRLLDAVVAREDAGPVRADALWELGVLAAAEGDAVRAGDLALRFAREYPRDARAADAISYAVHHARVSHETATVADRPAARRVYLDALRLAESRFARGADRDRRRVELARLMLEPGPDADREGGLALLEAIDASSPVAPAAGDLYERVMAESLDAARTAFAEARRAGDADRARRLGPAAAADARRAAAWAGSRRRPSLSRFLADRADAAVESGTTDDAAGLYRDLLTRGANVPGGEARVRLGLGRALLLDGDEAGGFAALRDLVSAMEGVPGAKPEEYWHAWTLMLEVLAKQGGERAGPVRVQLKRLESLDAALGGEPWRSRIRALADAP
ncbi:MAG: hypothetical protein ACKVU4_04495 [Phycisphaerales bacterium]